MDAQHIIEVLVICLLGLIGFIGLRVHNSLDKLTTKHALLDKENTRQHAEIHTTLKLLARELNQ